MKWLLDPVQVDAVPQYAPGPAVAADLENPGHPWLVVIRQANERVAAVMLRLVHGLAEIARRQVTEQDEL